MDKGLKGRDIAASSRALHALSTGNAVRKTLFLRAFSALPTNRRRLMNNEIDL